MLARGKRDIDKISGSPIYQEVYELYHSEPIQTLRSTFVELIKRHNVPQADNILKTTDGVNYLYCCTLVHRFVPDKFLEVVLNTKFLG